MLYYMNKVLFNMQLYDRRKRHLRSNKEREKWMQIDYHYMMEESDIDEEKVGQHKLPWRSNSNVDKLCTLYNSSLLPMEEV